MTASNEKKCNCGSSTQIKNLRSIPEKISCEDCFKENMSQAIVHLNRSMTSDTPKSRWLAIAFLLEAMVEIAKDKPEIAKEIYDIRSQMIQDKTFSPDLMKYL